MPFLLFSKCMWHPLYGNLSHMQIFLKDFMHSFLINTCNVCASNSCRDYRLSSSKHYAITARATSVRIVLGCPVRRMSALETHPRWNAAAHLATVLYGRARLPKASVSSEWRSDIPLHFYPATPLFSHKNVVPVDWLPFLTKFANVLILRAFLFNNNEHVSNLVVLLSIRRSIF